VAPIVDIMRENRLRWFSVSRKDYSEVMRLAMEINVKEKKDKGI